MQIQEIYDNIDLKEGQILTLILPLFMKRSVYMNEIKNCSQFIKDFRKERNLTQEDLAEVLQYSQKSIAKWEQCVALPPMDVLIKLKELSGKTIDEILGLKDAELKKEDLVNE